MGPLVFNAWILALAIMANCLRFRPVVITKWRELRAVAEKDVCS